MAIHSKTFVIITNRLIVNCLKKRYVSTKFEKNRTKPGNPYYLLLFENCTKPGTVLRDHPSKTSAFFRGGGVKNLPNLLMDSSKKLTTVGG